MSQFVLEKVYKLSNVIEFLISLTLAIVITILTGKLLLHSGGMAVNASAEEILNDVLASCMTLAVGVEFIKMLCKHTPNTIIETLMFAIARAMVVEHVSAIETMIGVLSIAVLFATKKYLFCSFSEVDRITLRGSQNVQMANLIAKVKIPHDGNKLLREVVEESLQEDGRTTAIGSCVYFSDFALSIANMRDGKITRVDVLKSV